MWGGGCPILARFLRKGGIPRKRTPRLLYLILPLGDAAFQRRDQLHFSIAALQFAEKLKVLNRREGHEFTRAVKSWKVCLRFSAGGALLAIAGVKLEAWQRWDGCS